MKTRMVNFVGSGVLVRCLLLMVLGSLTLSRAAEPAEKLQPLVQAWLAAQTNVHAWSADFTQTRSLKSLTQPLTAKGHVWFAEPNRFHWELGNPVQTIAVRAPTEMLLFYPKLKRVERYPLNGAPTGPWRDALALLDTGFARSQSELEARYHILKVAVEGPVCQVTLEPKAAAARRLMPRITIGFDTKDYALRSTELQFADGSTLRNDFVNPVLNPQLEDTLFNPPIPPDYKVTEPLK